ncbi:enoyl-ACP reductase FabI [Sedimentimonas flavescens]|uniref:Enoyl-[acyl-carrier-protein] reductase [NADH] n=1 Tax=Sedimentimonas flavescens TaxID=2851012 RepID=A0ABT2ZVC1_9RHOB|nr:enoyl-ACP reductase FabI [Sedimentimonas flavescens]MBW0156652.1 enoyl-ACP reductase FabI [Sedimentimonas flavescens]MCT2539146.1 enoyl-ACP reductase FabI [Sedimentimonas flavescens]MCV2877690.1 enoyl-ACP reductase FabI [Sedimentimonas flavescens]WBL32417.1 enoyl-ACP reductase FabI [Sinirhodobacter sp. HNIBRBA609]
MFSLEGQKVLVVGIANAQSIAYGCARAFRAQGAELGVTWLNARAEPHVRPLAEELGATIKLPLDVTAPGQMEDVFEEIGRKWGRLDTILHSIAFAPKADLHGRVIDSSAEGFGQAMDISVHSFLRMIRMAEPLMPEGGTCLSVSFFGSTRVVRHYNIMGPVKAALESSVRYAAAELGEKGIRVHALSPGPLVTRAASGIDHFDDLLIEAANRAPTHMLASIDDIGAMAAFLASREARNLTGGVHDIDGGYSITA